MVQDLPNYAQHIVPIFSLPQELLWYESWCGNATNPRQKQLICAQTSCDFVFEVSSIHGNLHSCIISYRC